MIDTTAERVVTLAQAAAELPLPAAGSQDPRLDPLPLGDVGMLRRVVLETIQVGATRCTSREALQRFYERLSAGRPGDGRGLPRTTARRLRDSEAAARELERLGA